MTKIIDTNYLNRTALSQKILLVSLLLLPPVMFIESSVLVKIWSSNAYIVWAPLCILLVLYLLVLFNAEYTEGFHKDGSRKVYYLNEGNVRHFEWYYIFLSWLILYVSFGFYALIVPFAFLIVFNKEIRFSFRYCDIKLNRPFMDSDWRKVYVRKCAKNKGELAVSNTGKEGAWQVILINMVLSMSVFAWNEVAGLQGLILTIYVTELAVFLFFLVRRLYWGHTFGCSFRAARIEAF